MITRVMRFNKNASSLCVGCLPECSISPNDRADKIFKEDFCGSRNPDMYYAVPVPEGIHPHPKSAQTM
eukprot:5402011-Amphidinium_carterae.1